MALRRVALVALAFLGGCVDSRDRATIRFQPHRESRSSSAFNCYFVDTTGHPAPAGAPACVGLGGASALVSWGELTGTGVSLRIPLRLRQTLRVWGVGSAEACAGASAVADLFKDGLRPDLFVLGETDVGVSPAPEVAVPDTYAAGTTVNRGACEAPAPRALAFSPVQGGHRGGVTLTVNGDGFVAGATASVGGVPCVSNTWVSSSQLLCVTPSVPPQLAEVTVRNPNGLSAAVPSPYRALTFVYVGFPGAVSFINYFPLDPDTGALGTPQSVNAPVGDLTLEDLAVHPSGKWLYSSHNGNDDVVRWEIDPETGKPQSPISLGVIEPDRLILTPGGGHLLISGTGGTGALFSYEVDSGDGTLVFASSLMLAGVPSELATNRTGTAVYFLISASTVQGRRFNADDGGFTALPGSDPFNPVMSVIGLAPHPVFDLLYAADREGVSKARSGTADATTGEVAEIADGAAPPNAADLAVDPLGRFAFVIGQDVGGKYIQNYDLSEAGGITPPGGPTVISGSVLSEAVVDPSGRFLLVSDGSSTVDTVRSFPISPISGAVSAVPAGDADLNLSVRGLTVN